MWFNVLRGHRQHNHSIECIHEFLFEFNRNYEAISYRFLYIIDRLFSKKKLKKSRDNDHALSGTICRPNAGTCYVQPTYYSVKQKLWKSAFSEGVRHFERKFQVDEDVARNRSMDRWIGE